MPLLAWSDKLMLNISTIDGEHKQLVSWMNQLAIAATDNDNDIIKNLFENLKQYTMTHFKNEELYMESLDYPDLPRHKAKHFELKSMVAEFQRSLNDNQAININEILKFIRHWLIDHIVAEDMKIKTHRSQITN
ncbi:bacteriohemerythrin [Desulfovibrio aerotolerans]|uniref:Bacteriohemerythrin n=1 Tax=Solidesulfovibrio aerotolerans TaxID=295255 RepID=A0A7C9MG73_9BACT|nr:bacteriohemerythrin [Solidesulfovibrio aerotolerans]MYL84050.1 bacteriohemerythrin [Solidesulfovibrio aerotolerans]